MIFDEIDGRVGLAKWLWWSDSGGCCRCVSGVLHKDGKQRRIKKRKDTSCQPPSNSKMFDGALWLSARSDKAKELRQLDGRASQQRRPIFAEKLFLSLSFMYWRRQDAVPQGVFPPMAFLLPYLAFVTGKPPRPLASTQSRLVDLWVLSGWSSSSFDFAGVVDQCVWLTWACQERWWKDGCLN